MSTTSKENDWLELVTQCRSSGLTDRQWCIENGIPVSTFYYHVRALCKKACAVPEAANTSTQKQEVVQIPLWKKEQNPSAPFALSVPSVCLEIQGIRVEIHEQAGADVIRNTLLALRQLLLGELSGVAKFFLVTGYTDMRKSIDGLMAIIRDTYELNPYSNSLFLFCGRRCDRIKALHFEKDGFCLYYKRLDNGRFQWPRDSSEVRNLSRQE